MLIPGDPRLWVYERKKKRVFRNIPKSLAHKRGYYTIVRADGTGTTDSKDCSPQMLKDRGFPSYEGFPRAQNN
jgi:hypothetical protein